MKYILLAALLGACSPVGDEIPKHLMPNTVETIYTPGPGAEYPLEIALFRMELATGLPFYSAPGGVPVDMVEHAPDAVDGSTTCAATTVSAHLDHGYQVVSSVGIQVSDPLLNDCWQDVSRTIEHEIIHSLRRKVLKVIEANGDFDAGAMLADHTSTGIFKLHSTDDDKMDIASLTKVCEAIECVVFNPEN